MQADLFPPDWEWSEELMSVVENPLSLRCASLRRLFRVARLLPAESDYFHRARKAAFHEAILSFPVRQSFQRLQASHSHFLHYYQTLPRYSSIPPGLCPQLSMDWRSQRGAAMEWISSISGDQIGLSKFAEVSNERYGNGNKAV